MDIKCYLYLRISYFIKVVVVGKIRIFDLILSVVLRFLVGILYDLIYIRSIFFCCFGRMEIYIKELVKKNFLGYLLKKVKKMLLERNYNNRDFEVG